MKRLQVKLNNNWEYVFCRNELKNKPITTNNRLKAIKGDQNSLEYFQKFFGNLEFRIVN